MAREKKEIAMPPLDSNEYDDGFGIQEGRIAPSTSTKSSGSSISNNAQNNDFNVPSEVPREIAEEMDNMNENNSIQEEIVEQDNVQSMEDASSVEEQLDDISASEDKSHANTQEKPSNSPAHDSFRAIREAKEKAEQERDELRKKLMEQEFIKKYESQSHKQPEQPEVIDDDIDFSLDEDGLVEGRYVKKVTNKIKNLEKKLQNYESQYTQQTAESKIKQECPDFDKVVSNENINLLKQHYPHIADTLGKNTDLYNKAVSAYKIIKQFGIYKENPHAEAQAQAIKNSKRPKPTNSVSPQRGDSPISKANLYANGLSEAEKKKHFQEMLRYSKNR